MRVLGKKLNISLDLKGEEWSENSDEILTALYFLDEFNNCVKLKMSFLCYMQAMV